MFPLAMQAATTFSVDLYGGYLEDVVIGPDGYGYAAFMAPNGLYVSTDLSTWQALDASYDTGECISLGVDNAYVYAICGIELYRSNDGFTWDQLGLMNVGQYMYADNNRVIVVMRNTGEAGYMTLAISEDHGDTWIEDIEVTGVNNFLWMSGTGNTVYALASVSDLYRIYKSVDGGLHWSETGYSVDSNASLSLAVKNGDDTQVALQSGDNCYVSTDGGVTFTDLERNVGGEVQFIDDDLYCGLNYTSDYVNWNSVEGDSIPMGGNDVTISGQTILTGTSVGVGVSTDGGDTWVDTKEGINALQVDDIAQKIGDKNKVILAIYGGLARTDNYRDASPTWNFNTEIGSSTAVFYGTDLALVGAGEMIYYSTDDALTWTEAGPAGGTVTDFIRVDGVYYASYNGGVLSSEDGITWDRIGLEGILVNSLASTSTGKIYAAVGGEGDTDSVNLGIYKYDGSSWTQLMSEGFYNDILVVNNDLGNNIAYAISGSSAESEFGQVMRSDDYGTTWDDMTGNGLPDDG